MLPVFLENAFLTFVKQSRFTFLTVLDPHPTLGSIITAQYCVILVIIKHAVLDEIHFKALTVTC